MKSLPTRRLRGHAAVAATALLLGALSTQTESRAQGCVIARGAPVGLMTHNSPDGFPEAGEWQATIAHRWFKSDRHFVGTVEQPQRQANGTQVINDSHFIDAIATYNVTKQFSLNLTVPWVIHDRSSLYEHMGNASGQRFHTQSGGLADMRLGANYWLIKPEKYDKGNIAFGIGVKAPTGDYKATDIFYRPAGPTLRYVDTSIQPGDGGWGFFLDTQAYHQIWGNLSAYFNGSYLFNPRELVPATGYSVPDSYLGRAGFAYTILPKYGLALTFGARVEGVPPEDAIGGSLGSRRPGYSLGVEPGVSVMYKKFTFNLTTPVAIERNRQRTYNAAATGDAAFADYSINSSLTYRF